MLEQPSVASDPPKASSGIGRLLGAAPYVLLGLTLMVWVKVAAAPLVMPDTYFNIRYGQEFLSGHWSLTNPGSPTPFATAHWTPTQWSSEIVMAWFNNHFGLAGVCWVMGTLGLLLLVALYRLARMESGALVAALVTTLTMIMASVSLSLRAQLISYLLTAVFVAAMMRMREDGRIRWWLIPLMWVWVTAHGMWPVGLSILGVGAVGIVLETRSREIARRMALLVGLVVVAAAVTPMGLRAYEAVLAVSSRRSYITEWAPTNFMSPTNAILAVCIVGVLVVGLRRQSALPWVETLLLVLGLGWALYCARGVPVAAVILVPHLARLLQRGVRTRRSFAGERWIVGGLLAAMSAVLAFSVTSQPGAPFQPKSWETTALDAMPSGTVVLNEQALGGYLLWRYPGLSISSYGYFDTYTDAEFTRFERLVHLQPGWIDDVRTSGAHVALLAADSPLAYGLVHTLHWKVVESDSAYQLLHAPDL
ncbi:hypothetical protein [Nocardioides baekrokdamisoli]|nr:hypothetical protein [Nocardioides baekrokdamisoli]